MGVVFEHKYFQFDISNEFIYILYDIVYRFTINQNFLTIKCIPLIYGNIKQYIEHKPFLETLLLSFLGRWMEQYKEHYHNDRVVCLMR